MNSPPKCLKTSFRSYPHLWVLLGIVFASLVTNGCDGEDALAAPTVQSVSPTGVVGRPENAVTFTATVTGPVTSYQWDFAGATNPPSSGASSPDVRLVAAGEHTGSLVVCNGAECSPPFPFTFSVDGSPLPPAPRIVGVTPIQSTGRVGDTARFSTEVEGELDRLLWDFSGGTRDRTSSEPNPEVAFAAGGTFAGSLTACLGESCSDPFTFLYEVIGAPNPNRWHEQVLEVGAIDFIDHPSPEIVLADGVPIIAYIDFIGPGIPVTSDPILTLARPVQGSSPSGLEWETLRLRDPNTGSLGRRPQLAAMGQDIVVIANAPNTGLTAYLGDASAEWIRDAWTNHSLLDGATAFSFELVAAEGHWYLGYDEGTPWIASTPMTQPAISTDWTHGPVPIPSSEYGNFDLAVAGGRPALTYSRSGWSDRPIVLQTASAAPSMIEDWQLSEISTDENARFVDLATYRGRLAAAYDTFAGNGYLALADVAVPVSPADWTVTQIHDRGARPRVIDLNGMLAVVYTNYTGEFCFPTFCRDWFSELRLARTMHDRPTAEDWVDESVISGGNDYLPAQAVIADGSLIMVCEFAADQSDDGRFTLFPIDFSARVISTQSP